MLQLIFVICVNDGLKIEGGQKDVSSLEGTKPLIKKKLFSNHFYSAKRWKINDNKIKIQGLTAF